IEIVDFQLHEPAPFEEWDDVSSGVRTRVLTESLLQWLDSVGVDGAVLYPMEDWDWAAQLTTRFPGRFAAVVRLGAPGSERTAQDREAGIPPVIAADSPTLEDDIMLARGHGIAALRLALFPKLAPDEMQRFIDGAFDRALSLCEKHGVPVLLAISGRLDAV